MSDFLNGLKRTDMCGSLRSGDIGRQVTIMGWVVRRRDLGNLIFVQVRDKTGVVQAVFDSSETEKALFDKAFSLRQEYVVAVGGVVRARVGDNVNKNMETGDIEIVADSLKILSEADTPPFAVGDESANEALRLKYRYLDLRREKLQDILSMRSKLNKTIREYMYAQGFTEVETPMLGKSTPEGARDYLVPSRVHHGKFYALPQSPQLYKQLLMIGGTDRYFQIARCFRDEDLRANRQPEFTQLDVEMSFMDREDDVMGMMEGLFEKIFREIKGIEISLPLRRITYAEAMTRYGSDAPDTRFGMEINDLSDTVKNSGFAVFDGALNAGGKVRAIVLKDRESALSRKELDKLADLAKTYKAKGLAWLGIGSDGLRSSFASKISAQLVDEIAKKLELKKGDMAFFVADADDYVVCTALGAVRKELAARFDLIDKNRYDLLWVVDFPLFEYSEEEGRYVAMHHPFTSPKDEDLPFMENEPSKVRAKAYDIVINGQEAGGGSLRIYKKEIQNLMFKTLGFSQEQIENRFGFFVNAFNFGTPPHGGIALGLDRFAMLLANTDNIKDVIAFPKVQNASCLMTEAPGVVENRQLEELAIELKDVEEG